MRSLAEASVLVVLQPPVHVLIIPSCIKAKAVFIHRRVILTLRRSVKGGELGSTVDVFDISLATHVASTSLKHDVAFTTTLLVAWCSSPDLGQLCEPHLSLFTCCHPSSPISTASRHRIASLHSDEALLVVSSVRSHLDCSTRTPHTSDAHTGKTVVPEWQCKILAAEELREISSTARQATKQRQRQL